MSPALVDFDDLRKISRLGPRATLARVERWARGQGIRFKYDGSGGIWTTVDALNAAVGIGAPHDGDAYSPDMVM